MKTSYQWMKMFILLFMEPDVQQCNVQFNAGVIFCHTEQDPTLLSFKDMGRRGWNWQIHLHFILSPSILVEKKTKITICLHILYDGRTSLNSFFGPK